MRRIRPEISVAVIVAGYTGVIGVAFLAETLHTWTARLLVLPLIGAFQNHLQILQHEGAHGKIHPDRKWNEALTDLFCSIPFGGLLRHYRFFHFEHHRNLLDPGTDPEVSFYREQGHTFEPHSLRSLLGMGFRDLSGYHYVQFFGAYQAYLVRETRGGRLAPVSPREWIEIAVVVLMAALVGGLPHGGFFLVFYWFLPQLTWMFFFLKLQGYGEHTKRAGSIGECTHDIRLNGFARFFIYPLNSELHRAHHLRPEAPWYELREIAKYTAENYFGGERSVVASLLGRSPAGHDNALF